MENEKESGIVIEEKPAGSGAILHRSKGSDLHVVVPDGGIRAWLVCLTASLCAGSIWCIVNSFGVMYSAFQEEFTDDSDTARNLKTSSIWSIATGMSFGLSPIVSILIDKFGIRAMAFLGSALTFLGMLLTSFMPSYHYVYLTYGIMFGSGVSFINTSSVVILGHYFKRYLGRANGIVTAGSGFFSIAAPYLLNFLIKSIGLRHTLQAISGMLALSMGYSLVWKPTFNTKKATIQTQHSKSSLQRKSRLERLKILLNEILRFDNWRNKNYVIWTFAMPASLFGYFISFVHLIKYVEMKNPDFDGPGLLITMSVSSAVSRVVTGPIADHPRVSRIFLQQMSFVIMGTCTSVLPLVNNYIGLVVLILIVGFCDGCFITVIGPIAFDLVGPQGAAQAVGFLMGLCAIPLMSGPSLAGLLFDNLGTYDIAYHLAGIPPLLGAILMFLIKKPRKTRKSVTLAEDFQIWSSRIITSDGQPSEYGSAVITSRLDMHGSLSK